jgi:hypothetical protein
VNRRVEVLPGPGLVVRFGEVIAWAGPQASSSLITFLVDGARNLADDPNGGRLLADHLRGVLVNGDPEPAVPFVTIGPSTAGLDALMHGPIQLWDGMRWHMVSPTPGWLRELLPATGTVLTGPAGAQPPNLAIGSPLNLISGVVPGGGLAIVAVPSAPPAPAASGAAGATPSSPEPAAPAEGRSPFAPPDADAPRDMDAPPREQSPPEHAPPEQSPSDQPPGSQPPA